MVEAETVELVGVVDDILSLAFEVRIRNAFSARVVADIREEAGDDAGAGVSAQIAERRLERTGEGAAGIVECPVCLSAEGIPVVVDLEGKFHVRRGEPL